MRPLLASLLALLVTACASVPANAPAYTRAPTPPAGLSNVYLYRIGAYPTLRAPMVRVNDITVISPAERAYTVIQVPPGQHDLVIDWAWDTGWPDITTPFTVEPGVPLYLKISGDFERMGGGDYLATSLVMAVPMAEAEREMLLCCRYVRPLRGGERPYGIEANARPRTLAAGDAKHAR